MRAFPTRIFFTSLSGACGARNTVTWAWWTRKAELVGAITQRDLLRLQADEALAFADALGEAVSLEELALVWRKLANAARSLLHEDVDARDIAGIISAKCAA